MVEVVDLSGMNKVVVILTVSFLKPKTLKWNREKYQVSFASNITDCCTIVSVA